MGELHQLKPDQRPLVEAVPFSELNSEFLEDWSARLPGFPRFLTKQEFFGDYFWRFNGGDNGREIAFEAAKITGKIALKVSLAHREFSGRISGISNIIIPAEVRNDDEVREIAVFGLISSSRHRFYNPTRTALGLIEATNEDLRNINMPFQLPVPTI